MSSDPDICEVAADDSLGLDDILAVEDDVLRTAKDAGSGHPVTTGSLNILGLVERNVRQLHLYELLLLWKMIKRTKTSNKCGRRKNIFK